MRPLSLEMLGASNKSESDANRYQRIHCSLWASVRPVAHFSFVTGPIWKLIVCCQVVVHLTWKYRPKNQIDLTMADWAFHSNWWELSCGCVSNQYFYAILPFFISGNFYQCVSNFKASSRDEVSFSKGKIVPKLEHHLKILFCFKITLLSTHKNNKINSLRKPQNTQIYDLIELDT